MAKKNLTQATYAVDNVQQLPVQVKGQASLVQQTFDKASLDQKTYNNDTLLVELADETANNSGSNTIGHNSTSITADNVGDSLEENRLKIDTNETNISNLDTDKANDNEVVKLTGNQTIAGVKTFSSLPTIPETPLANTDASSKGYVDTEIAGVVLGQIPDNSLTNAKLGTDVKVGSLALLNTTDKSDVTSAINEVNQSVTNRDTATDGQVLTSNGDGTATYEDLAGAVVIDETTLVSDVASYDISWTTGLYKKIILIIEDLKVNNVTDRDLHIRFNGISTAGSHMYSRTYASIVSGSVNAFGLLGRTLAQGNEDAIVGSAIVGINTNEGKLFGTFDIENQTGTTTVSLKDNVEITSFSLFPSSDLLATGSKFKVLGVADYA